MSPYQTEVLEPATDTILAILTTDKGGAPCPTST